MVFALYLMSFDFWNWLKFQTGLMGGLISGGLQVDLKLFKLRLLFDIHD